ncbi:hypothetical protein FJ934_09610 [Mesorhizobium sp. B2-4-12]|uniref:hypothetical protein n=1 Tax=Mesorhizobium sp. B2-4-12 TaxID=2589937 RepID=UPI001129BD4B|nr:hypothetical protein [Mesorhizobium sp. B2-4-12]TPK96393.1 hypothetical protein FJ934_09610 [Mesorhizobium sp. B2-4-12]
MGKVARAGYLLESNERVHGRIVGFSVGRLDGIVEVAHPRGDDGVHVAIWSGPVGRPGSGEICPKGVLFKSLESGAIATVTRHGFGYAYFTMERDHLQPAVAAEILTKEGEHGFIYGPMRSYMFVVDPETLKDFT